MKFDALVLLAATTTTSAVNAFFLPASTATTTRLEATVEKTSTTSGKLIPPLSPSEICTQDGRVGGLYDGNVQKTYG